ncbi:MULTISPECIES: Tol-Pal system beta propeller repeat protein TolB [Cycloclasticus]|jgi:TolB protein|uniref:Tol-Pal system protein TolB n=1 Tax=Cycloclasticus zancles 78-ME TaxID=1198232 RepID=S5TA59_9GAMM|nr:MULTISPECIES: Tol-Pal system beta propeller repeat protein TolB [Cycloclasticus]AGS40479.1 Translocation protein TolB [Cycloclasticus zancles 78-ME]MDF1830392.1 Tol-Pal system beta propeller repeat protein TolB [Cycloclasticus pugetii]
MQKMIKTVLFLSAFVTFSAMSEALRIEITQGVSSAQPIVIVPFSSEQVIGGLPVDIAQIVSDDLARSGRFKPLPRTDMLNKPSSAEQVNFRNWQSLGQDNLVIGRVTPTANGMLTVQFQLFDVYKGEQLTGFSIPANTANLRGVAHRISDLIYENLTGQQGAFSTRMAYVTSMMGANGKQEYKIQVADADGYGAKTIVTSTEPLMSPSWSPRGDKISYVSYEGLRSSIYTQTLRTGQREKLRSFKGINGAPSWSPDGSQLALTLSKDGSADIYIYNVITRSFRRLTRSYAIDTEPDWSPDGRHIIFTSDRGGKPQIYRISASGGQAARVTFEGSYNARASYSPDGKYIVMVHRVNGQYRIATLDLKSGFTNILTNGSLDESPSYAPNGSMILYSTNDGLKSILAAVSSDGKVRQKLRLQEGEVREPAWSPFK